MLSHAEACGARHEGPAANLRKAGEPTPSRSRYGFFQGLFGLPSTASGPLRVAASWQQLKSASEPWTNSYCTEIPAICRQNAVHVSSLSDGNDRPIDQS